jgi:C-3',4' desaturase CrtD
VKVASQNEFFEKGTLGLSHLLALEMANENSYDVAVIGAGIAGLSAAALLQNSGARVLLLEAHENVGGCAGWFDVEDARLGRFRFDVGATVALGLETGGLHRRVFDRLGARAEASVLDGLRVVLPRHELFWAHDTGRWRAERRRLPGNRLGQEIFWRLQETVADAGWRALAKLPSFPLQTSRDWLRSVALIDPRLVPLAPFLHSTVRDVVRILRLEHDREFCSLVNLALMISVQNEMEEAPFSNACSGLDLWRHGAWHARGGIGQIARVLHSCFARDGGETRFGARVGKIEKTARGFQIFQEGEIRPYLVPRVVANLTPETVNRIFDLPSRALKRVEEMRTRTQSGWGAVTLYAALRDEALPANAPLHHQVLLDEKARPGDGRDVFLSLSARDDENQAPRGWRTLTVSTHTHLDDWKDLSPHDYRTQKKRWREQMLEGVRHALPEFDAHSKFVIGGTPQTWNRFAGRASVGGVRLTPRNSNLRAFPSRLGVRNFWLCGDSVFPGQGTVACALSGLNVWRDITNETL